MKVSRRLYFTRLDDTELERLKGSCREYTLPRSHQSSQVKGWNRGNTKIGSVLDVRVGCHQGRYGVEIMIETFFGDKTCSEMSDETHVENIGEKSTGKLVAKARPRQTSNSTLSLLSFLYRERMWIDVEPGTFDHNCLEVSKLMIRLVRHDDSVNREEDGAVRFEDLASVFRSRITS